MLDEEIDGQKKHFGNCRVPKLLFEPGPTCAPWHCPVASEGFAPSQDGHPSGEEKDLEWSSGIQSSYYPGPADLTNPLDRWGKLRGSHLLRVTRLLGLDSKAELSESKGENDLYSSNVPVGQIG